MPLFGGRRNRNDRLGPDLGRIRHAEEAETAGIAYLKDGNLAKAEAALRRGVTLNPQSALGHGFLALTLYRLDRFVEAGVESRDAVYLAPTDHVLHHTHGMIFEALERLDEAAIAYCKAIELKPDSARAHASLGSLSLKRGDIQAAENLIGAALNLDPNDVQAVEDMAEIRRRQGKIGGAISVLTTALRSQPSNPTLNFKVGQLLAENKQEGAAISAFQKALEQKPHDPEILFALGATMLQLGRHVEVRHLYDTATKRAPSSRQRYEADLRRLLVEHMAAEPTEEGLPEPRPSHYTPSGRLMLDAMPALISTARPGPVSAEPVLGREAAHTRASALGCAPAQAPPHPFTRVTASARDSADNPYPAPSSPCAADRASARDHAAASAPALNLTESIAVAPALAPAIAALEEKVKGQPSNSRLYRDLSILYLRAGRLPEAMQMGRKAEQLHTGARQAERVGWS